jgi:hypothetical protein
MFSVKSFFITGVSLSVIMLSSCVSEQKSTASSNTTPDSTALIENDDWSVYMKAPEYHFDLAQKHLQKGDIANASIQLKRGNSFLIF